MTTSAGQPVTAAVFNNAYMSRLDDTSTSGKVALENIETTTINDIQAVANEVMDTLGTTEGDATRKNYSSNDVVSNGDSHKVAIGKLDAYVGDLNTSISNHVTDLEGAHAATAIAVTPVGNLAANDVQEALEELQGDINTLTSGLVVEHFYNSTIDATVINGVTGVDVSGSMTDANKCLWQLRRTSTTEWLAIPFTTTTTHVIFNPEVDVDAGNYTLIGMGVS